MAGSEQEETVSECYWGDMICVPGEMEKQVLLKRERVPGRAGVGSRETHSSEARLCLPAGAGSAPAPTSLPGGELPSAREEGPTWVPDVETEMGREQERSQDLRSRITGSERPLPGPMFFLPSHQRGHRGATRVGTGNVLPTFPRADWRGCRKSAQEKFYMEHDVHSLRPEDKQPVGRRSRGHWEISAGLSATVHGAREIHARGTGQSAHRVPAVRLFTVLCGAYKGFALVRRGEALQGNN